MRAIISFAIGSFFAITAAAVPFQLTQQGRLLDSSDQPLSGAQTITFTLWDASTGTNTLWTDDLSVTFDNGYYSVILGGSSNPIDENVLDNVEVWMSLTIGGEELLPRHRVNSSPYAIMAGTAESVAGGIVDAARISVGGTEVVDSSGEWVGTAPADTLSGLTCNADDVVVYLGSGWDCVPGSSFDSVLSEAEVEGYVSNGVINLFAGTTLAGQTISTGAHIATDLTCTNCVEQGEVDFNYAGSTVRGGAATDLSCTDCLTATEVASADLAYNVSCTNCLTMDEVASADYATTAGTAADVSCTNCLTTDEVASADYATTAGTAADVSCTNCLTTDEVASADYATTAGTAADVSCTNCLTGTDIATSAIRSSEINGTEIQIYTHPSACNDPGILTTATVCVTRTCTGGYRACDNSCPPLPGPTVCNTSALGFLLSQSL